MVEFIVVNDSIESCKKKINNKNKFKNNNNKNKNKIKQKLKFLDLV